MWGHQRYEGAPLSFSASGLLGRQMEVPCGRCRQCRLDRSREHAIRCVHESQMHAQNCFVTLTYSDEFLPPGGNLVYRDYQLFMKRLIARRGPVRFFMSGEYGDVTGRPHYHAILFGVDFGDRVPWMKGESGAMSYSSAELDSIWQLGRAYCGDATFESAAYVARYVMKKQLGSDRGARREIVDITSGQIVERVHEFCHMSLRPGIGRTWLDKFWSDVYPWGQVTVPGSKLRSPRYYDKQLELRDPDAFARLKLDRVKRAELQWDDNSPARLRAKDEVLKARVGFLKRSDQ